MGRHQPHAVVDELHVQRDQRLTLARPEYTQPILDLEQRAVVGALYETMFRIQEDVGHEIQLDAEVWALIAISMYFAALPYHHYFAVRRFHADGITIRDIVK
jgi:hypothetical protein